MQIVENQIFGGRLVINKTCCDEDFASIGIRVPTRKDKYCLTKCLRCGKILPTRKSDLLNRPPKRCMYCSNIGNHFNVETTRNTWAIEGNVAYCNVELNNKIIQFSIDKEDYDKVKEQIWRISQKKNKYYVISGSKKKNTMIYLHSFIMGKPPEGEEIDHVDGNSLNNRKSNLRFVTHIENIHNIRANRIDNEIGIRGICYNKPGKDYHVDFSYNGIRIYLKTWKSLTEAVWCRYFLEDYFDLPALKCNPEFEKYQDISEEDKTSIKNYVLNKIQGNLR